MAPRPRLARPSAGTDCRYADHPVIHPLRPVAAGAAVDCSAVSGPTASERPPGAVARLVLGAGVVSQRGVLDLYQHSRPRLRLPTAGRPAHWWAGCRAGTDPGADRLAVGALAPTCGITLARQPGLCRPVGRPGVVSQLVSHRFSLAVSGLRPHRYLAGWLGAAGRGVAAEFLHRAQRLPAQ